MNYPYFKRSITALLCLFVLSPLYSQKNLTTETRDLTSFEELKVSGPFAVELTSSITDKLMITGSTEMISLIVTEIKDGTLNIRPKKNAYLQNLGSREVKITIPLVPLNKISQSGSGKVYAEGPIIVPTITIRQSGSGKVDLTLQAHKTLLQASGSGRLQLKGETKKLQAKLSGSGQLRLQGLTTKEGDLSLSGSGRIQTRCTHRLKANVSGSGRILYHGEPEEKLNAKVAGSGAIRLVTQ